MDSTLFHFRDSTQFNSLEAHELKFNIWVSSWGGTIGFSVPFQVLRVTEWFAFWLQAKDVLRLDDIWITTTAENTYPKMKEMELPVESMVNLGMFKGKSSCLLKALAQSLFSSPSRFPDEPEASVTVGSPRQCAEARRGGVVGRQLR